MGNNDTKKISDLYRKVITESTNEPTPDSNKGKTISVEQLDRLESLKVRLGKRVPLFDPFISKVPVLFTYEIPTMAVDHNNNLYINPQFFDDLSDEGVVAVLAHELGHFKHKHIVKQMFVSLVLMFIVLKILGMLFYDTRVYYALGVINVNAANGILLTLIVLEIVSFFVKPILSLLSRNNEFEADSFATKMANKNDLINGLVKLSFENAAVLSPDWLYVKFYYSHPPLSERIDHLEKLK